MCRFIWIARGLSLSRRVRHLEERWAYYFAFGTYSLMFLAPARDNMIILVGLPSAALCIWGSTLANAALFALLFPSVSVTFIYVSFICAHMVLHFISIL